MNRETILFTINEIMSAVSAKTADFVSNMDDIVMSVFTDTRQVELCSAFFAIIGENFDGHNFVGQAIESGAKVAITNYQVGEFPCIVVKDTRMALLALAGYYRRKFSIPLVGITGSVGKTTTKEMVALVISAKYNTLKNEGNLNNEIGLSKTLFKLDNSYTAAVIEMGMSDFGEIKVLSEAARPTIGLITNIGYSHIQNLKSQNGILKAKLEILDGMDLTSPLILNADDKLLNTVADMDIAGCRKIFTYGISNKSAQYIGENISEDMGITKFNVRTSDGIVGDLEIPCRGMHNVLNALAAFVVGVNCGISSSDIAEALRGYETTGMRQKIVKRGGNTLIIDCYNASPDSMRASLEVLSQMKCECTKGDMCKGRRVAVLADMLELGERSAELHEMVGNMVHELGIDKLICYGKMAEYIANRARELGVDSTHTLDKTKLVNILKSQLKPHDIVLYKGSRGMKLEDVILILN